MPFTYQIRKCFFVLLLFLLAFRGQAQTYELASPDGKLKAQFKIEQGTLKYALDYGQKPIITLSTIKLDLEAPASFNQNLEISKNIASAKDTTWQPVYGERSTIRDNYRQLILTLRNPKDPNKYFQVIARAYNEGFAFRHFFPEQPSLQNIEVKGEQTTFTFPEGTKAYFTPRAQTKYELLPLAAWKTQSERPLTVVLPSGLLACVAEAEMVNFSRMKFALQAPNTLVTELYGAVGESAPFAAPWRIIMVAEKPGQLLQNNDILLNLNPPGALKNTAWIKPGKVIRETTLTTAGGKASVDFAVERGLQYIHFDAGWYGYEHEVASDASKVNVDPRRNPKNDLNLEEVIKYAKLKGIGVFLYVNHRALERQLDTIFPLYQKWGVAGVKFGFVNVGSHRWTTWLHDAVKKAAAYNLMVDIHDEYRPTGFSRTYPNLMTQEGIYGNEEFPDATHNTILPFTRFVAGAADYTFCYFARPELGRTGRFIKNTPVHQLALPVIYYSPLQWLFWYDKPSDYRGEPELEFWKNIPTVWDDTKVLAGEIGQYITVARRNGENWYLGTITNNDARTLDLTFSFLPAGNKYIAQVYEDGEATIPTRTHVAIKEGLVDNKTQLKITLKASGGQAIRLVPANAQNSKNVKRLR